MSDPTVFFDFLLFLLIYRQQENRRNDTGKTGQIHYPKAAPIHPTEKTVALTGSTEA